MSYNRKDRGVTYVTCITFKHDISFADEITLL